MISALTCVLAIKAYDDVRIARVKKGSSEACLTHVEYEVKNDPPRK